MDFYIATKLGEIFGEGFRGNAAVISKDEGFQSLRDYWTSRGKPVRRVILGESIERTIITANEANQRTALVRARLKSIDIGNFFSAYTESLELKRMLENAFADTEYSAKTGEMEDILKKGKTAKVIYLDTLRRFGRKDGLIIYNMLKKCAEF